jgi:hypothetical protein
MHGEEVLEEEEELLTTIRIILVEGMEEDRDILLI